MKARYLHRTWKAAGLALACLLILILSAAYLFVSIADRAVAGIAICATAAPASLIGLFLQSREALRCMRIARRWDHDLQLLKP